MRSPCMFDTASAPRRSRPGSGDAMPSGFGFSEAQHLAEFVVPTLNGIEQAGDFFRAPTKSIVQDQQLRQATHGMAYSNLSSMSGWPSTLGSFSFSLFFVYKLIESLRRAAATQSSV
ncbi:hypothetical protein, variant [Blastomyces gilchristii SLH14081]|uniref:Uncharacterized protein n=1 Tax=Blastomyces gilchristii (strain SLH14081) TaxID=559298 RepID=A0A179UIW1_BLAGS|nr:uncharacterized protein BDBG_16918 [Blastomyces gilchristii SLH14081]XP_031578032.1 hypothetical protein, variant [Blastomyces gilchristii SLH14081]OAT07924.1 hypothetical protein BDBG_16918 [Blastomyces gilchristii SLH14081]OAT07925.1 hypothetical protein, variant [Blastomyces gilchristii SLH14081]